MARAERNFKHFVALLLLKLFREGVAFLLHLGALCLVVRLFLNGRAECAAHGDKDESGQES
jgi:hypothetical protein